MMIRVSCLFISDGAFNDDECNVASMFSRNENGGIYCIYLLFLHRIPWNSVCGVMYPQKYRFGTPLAPTLPCRNGCDYDTLFIVMGRDWPI